MNSRLGFRLFGALAVFGAAFFMYRSFDKNFQVNEDLVNCFFDGMCASSMTDEERATAIDWTIRQGMVEFWATQAYDWRGATRDQWHGFMTAVAERDEVVLTVTQQALDLQQAAEAMATSEARLEAALQPVPIGIRNDILLSEINWVPNCDNESPYDGVWYPYGAGLCMPGVVSFNFWHDTNSPTYSIGLLTYYAEGVMERVLANREMTLPDGYVGAIAMPMCEDVGDTAWIRRPGEGFDGPFLVADCSAQLHLYYNLVELGMVAEVDWTTAQRYGMRGGMSGVGVCRVDNNPVERCPAGRASSMYDWFRETATFTTYDDTP